MQMAKIKYIPMPSDIGTRKVVSQGEISAYAAELLERDEISFVDVRSARNNCFQLRIVRDEAGKQ